MNLIPKPKKINFTEEKFKIKRNIEIILSYDCGFNDLEGAILLQKEIEKLLGIKANITKSFNEEGYEKYIVLKKDLLLEEEAYNLEINKDFIEIVAGSDSGIFYGIQTLIQIIKEKGVDLLGVKIEDKPYFKNRGFYHDITRGRVPTLETLMEIVDKAASYKINQIQLYIEHTFAFKGMSEVWINKDPLTAEEILLLDKYCKERHVDLVPSLSTFGHLYEVLRSKSFRDLCEMGNDNKEYSFIDRMGHHTLDVSNKESIKLVEKMLNEFIPLFSSKKFNICCDETFDLGKKNSLNLANELGAGRLYVNFLNEVISLVKKHDKEVMFWGDVISRHPELINEIDKDVICLNWNYSSEVIEELTKVIAENGRIQYVCPGVGGWNHLMNLMDNAFENIYRMVSYGVKHKAIGVLNTNWGDFGHINLWQSSVPGMIYGGALSWNPEIEKDFKQMYRDISILEFGDKSGELVGLLAELGKQQQLSWHDLVVWKEQFDYEDYLTDDLIRRMKEIPREELLNQHKRALEIEEKLETILINSNKKQEMQEFIVGARGIALIDLILLVIVNKEIYKEINKEDNHKEIAEKFETWFYDYLYIWRKTNKESEIYRIREVIEYTCDYLRSI